MKLVFKLFAVTYKNIFEIRMTKRVILAPPPPFHIAILIALENSSSALHTSFGSIKLVVDFETNLLPVILLVECY